ncbi:MAG: signal recognition particle-docking protein FtsY [Sphaerochaetaceae bacterium]|nr:signal recognition particle-docking protein FtsY [Sphaerochaetaceae bacterium]
MMKKSFGARLKALFGIHTFDESFFENLEDALIEGDLGAKTAMAVSDEIRKLAKSAKPTNARDLQLLMKDLLKSKVRAWQPPVVKGNTNVFLILGVNGVGKTTTIAKLAARYKKDGYAVMMAAADTFRAAAIDQLELHAERVGCRIVKHIQGADPGAVIFDALQSATAKKDELVLADTAGRMHNKENLLRELQKIDKVVKGRVDQQYYHKLLVIDATTGQNGLSQTELFNQAIGIDALILTKYDSAAKGGSIVQIYEKLHIPVAFVGTGERYDDIHPFDSDEFLDTLVGLSD